LKYIHEKAVKGKKLNLARGELAVVEARNAYNALPDLIKDLVHEFVLLPE